MKKQMIFLVLIAAMVSLPALAQSSTSFVICLNKSSQKLVVKQSCSARESLVSGKNLSSTTSTPAIKPTATPGPTGTIDFSNCYSTSAKKAGSPFDGRIAVGLLCKQGTDLLLNEQFVVNESSGAKSVLESKRLIIKGKFPNGVEAGFLATGGVNKYYEVQLAAVCCPASSPSSK